MPETPDCSCGGKTYLDWWRNYRVRPPANEAFVRCSQCGKLGPSAPDDTRAIELWREHSDAITMTKA